MKHIILLTVSVFLFHQASFCQVTTFDTEEIPLNEVEIKVSSLKTKFKKGEPIIITYELFTNTVPSAKVLLVNRLGLPIGMNASITDKNKNSVVVSPQLVLDEQLKDSYLDVAPDKPQKRELNLDDLVILKSGLDVKQLPKGTYYIRLAYFRSESNELKIEVE